MVPLASAGLTWSVNTHRFVYTSRRGEQSSEGLEFRNDEEAILCARSLLSEDIISIGVRRNAPSGKFERVGLWVWNRGAPRWKPEE